MKARIFLLLVSTIIWVATLKSLVDAQISDVSDDFEIKIKCLIDFSDLVFKSKHLVIYNHADMRDGYTNIFNNLLQYFAQNRILIIETITSDHPCINRKKWPYKYYIIFANTVKALNDIFEKCSYKKLGTKPPLFMIIADDTIETGKMLEIMKHHHIYQSPLITAFNETGVLFYKVKPGCSSNFLVQRTVYNCQKPVSKYKRQLSSNLKCEFKIGLHFTPPYVFKLATQIGDGFYDNLQGIELVLLRHLMKYQNHSMRIVSYTSTAIGHYYDETKTGSGLIEQLVNGQVDIILGAIANSNYSKHVEPFYLSTNDDKIAIVKRRKYSNFIKLFDIFSWEVWLFSFIFFLTLNAFTRIVAHFYKIPKPTGMVVFKLFTILLGKSIDFRRKHFKLLFLFWIWFTFMLRSCYEAKITSLFIDKDSSVQIDTLKELCEGNHLIFVDKYDEGVYKELMEFNDCKFSFQQFVHVENPLNELLNSKFSSVAAYMYKRQYMWELGKYNQKNVESLHVIKETLNPTEFYFYSRTGGILSSNLIKIPKRIQFESDFVKTYLKYNHFISLSTYKEDEKAPITLWELRSVFAFYFVGVILSFICFIIALGLHKLKLRKKRQ